MLAYQQVILFGLALIFRAQAVPVEGSTSSISRPVVTPGKGMPSLQSLNLTNEDLYAGDFLDRYGHTIPKRNADFARRNTRSALTQRDVIPSCIETGNFYGTRSNAIACRNYLISASPNACDVPGTSTVLCTAGDTEIVGWNYFNDLDGVDEDCSDVAIGASWIIDNCSDCQSDSCPVEGEALANGSNDYVVYIDESNRFAQSH